MNNENKPDPRLNRQRESWDSASVTMKLVVPMEMYKELHRVARRERESASAVIRRAVRFHLLADRAAERLLYGEE